MTDTNPQIVLAARVAGRLRIHPDAADQIVAEHLDQIGKTAGGVDHNAVENTLAKLHRAGAFGHTELQAVRDNADARAALDLARDDLILAALQAGARVTDVAEASGLNRDTIRRIRARA